MICEDIVIDSSDFAQLSDHLDDAVPLPYGNIQDTVKLVELEAMSRKLRRLLDCEENHVQSNNLKLDTIKFPQLPKLPDNDNLLKEFKPVQGKKNHKYRRRSSLLITGQTSRQNKLVLTTGNYDRPMHTKKQRRNSFIMAAEILGYSSVNNGESSSQEKYSSASHDSGDLDSYQDTVILSKDSFDLPVIPNQRRDSLLIASDRVCTKNEEFESKFMRERTGKRKFSRRNSVLLYNEKCKQDSFIMKMDPLELYEFSQDGTEYPTKANTFYLNHNKDTTSSNSYDKGAFANFMTETFPESSANSSRFFKKQRRLSLVNTKENGGFYNSYSSRALEPTQQNERNVNTAPKRHSFSNGPTSKLVSLCQAMKSSEESQFRIHDWDKKMGLRRSHSKTMRNSMKSRRSLLEYARV